MTYKQFQNKVLRSTWYDKYWYYFIYSIATFCGLHILYSSFKFEPNLENNGHIAMYIFIVFILTGGISGIYLIPNRYKVLTIESKLTAYSKEEIIKLLIAELVGKEFVVNECFYDFTYRRKWFTSEYNIYLSFDTDVFYLSVLTQTHGGIIDFGGTEQMRQSIKNHLLKLLQDIKE